MPLNEYEKLRQLLGEMIPDGGQASDTLFSDDEIKELLESNPEGDFDRAAYEGWRAKAAKLSSLVDTTEGNAQRKFSQLLTNALAMMNSYKRSTTGPTDGRSRVGTIRREPPAW